MNPTVSVQKPSPSEAPFDPNKPEFYINRELSWLEFNARVLGEALCPETPLLERLKFLSIFTSNLDEFFMVRVAGLKKMMAEGFDVSDSPDEMLCQDILSAIRIKTEALVKTQYDFLLSSVLPELEKHNVFIKKIKDLTDLQKNSLSTYFLDEVFPVLTPLALDPTHPFPILSNQALHLLVTFNCPPDPSTGRVIPSPLTIGFVELPDIIPRLIPVKGKTGEYCFVLLEDLVEANLGRLFLGFEIEKVYHLRVTRNLDYTLLENQVVDLLKTIQKELSSRELQEVVKVEIDPEVPETIIAKLKSELLVSDLDIYKVRVPICICGLAALYQLPLDHLKEPAFNPRIPKELAGTTDIFRLISENDILVHHPYESFYAVIDFLNAAAFDKDVLAIKQTLYRVAGDSPIIEALIAAAENGKQVTAVVELKARFDERNNIIWARRLERAGVNVVFGFIGLKTHSKATLIVRREKVGIRTYVHLSSGNYNSTTAKLYTDIGFFTARESFGKDVSAFFNLLTGFNILTGEKRLAKKGMIPEFSKIIMAPVNMRATYTKLITREIECHKKHGTGLIVAKMNALTDKEIIKNLYLASQAGVKIQLIVRGMCCLKPGVKGLSENIQVISILDRFLEHSRIFYFQAGGLREVYLSSADWMPRNMDRRIEICFPIENDALKDRIIKNILHICWHDNVKARVLESNGSYTLRKPTLNEVPVRSQIAFIEMARQIGIKSLPYEEAIHHNATKKTGERPVAKKHSKKLKQEPPVT